MSHMLWKAEHYPYRALECALIIQAWAHSAAKRFLSQVEYFAGGLSLMCPIHLHILWFWFFRGHKGGHIYNLQGI